MCDKDIGKIVSEGIAKGMADCKNDPVAMKISAMISEILNKAEYQLVFENVYSDVMTYKQNHLYNPPAAIILGYDIVKILESRIGSESNVPLIVHESDNGREYTFTGIPVMINYCDKRSVMICSSARTIMGGIRNG